MHQKQPPAKVAVAGCRTGFVPPPLSAAPDTVAHSSGIIGKPRNPVIIKRLVFIASSGFRKNRQSIIRFIRLREGPGARDIPPGIPLDICSPPLYLVLTD
jgi:hypothetical protein